MSSKNSKDIIKVLKKDDEILTDVVKWMYMQGHHKMYHECKGIDSDFCEGVGLRSTFVGRKCRPCYLAYKKSSYAASKKAQTQKKKK